MLFYSFNNEDPISKAFRVFVSVSMLRPLIKNLREFASEIVLGIIEKYKFRKGCEGIKIEPVVLSALDLLKSEKTDKEFLSLVKEGIVLWDEMKHRQQLVRQYT